MKRIFSKVDPEKELVSVSSNLVEDTLNFYVCDKCNKKIDSGVLVTLSRIDLKSKKVKVERYHSGCVNVTVEI